MTNSRLDLASAIPLDHPLVVYLEPTNVCNYSCTFCPESFPDYADQAGYYQQMPWNIFSKAVEDIKSWCRPDVIRFFFEGEPLLHPRLCKMISMARDMDLADRYELTTNLSLLTPDLAKSLVTSGLTYLRISVFGLDNESYATATGTRKWNAFSTFHRARILREARDKAGVGMEIHAQLINGSPEDEEKFQILYANVADRADIKPLHNWGSSDPRLVQLGQPVDAPLRSVCPQPFYVLLIKANGDTTSCCADWNGKLVSGNVLTNSLEDIWNSPARRNLESLHLAGRRGEIPSCASCTIPEQMPDVIPVRS